MIKGCKPYDLKVILGHDKKAFYDVPKYQREYTWNKPQWEALFNDLVGNSQGYFLGTIICVNNSKSTFEETRLSLIDGQQRLTSLSLLLLATYKELENYKDSFKETELDKFRDLKKEIVVLNDNEEPVSRVVLQIQQNNQADYYYLLFATGLFDNFPQVKFWKKRKIYRAYKFFQEQLLNYLTEEKQDDPSLEDKTVLFNFLKKINGAIMVYIEVDTNQDAYMLFESLNNRGVPLSAIDLIKNLIISKSDESNETDKAYRQWEKIIDYLGGEYGSQERFFRQFFNAYRDELNSRYDKEGKKYGIGYLATKSTLLDIYEKLIKADYRYLLSRLEEEAKYYSIITNKPSDDDVIDGLVEPLLNLERIGGAPSYLLLLYLFSKKKNLAINIREIKKTVNQLIKFFVRRNLTDFPNTRNLNKIFMEIISAIKDLSGEYVVKKIFEILKEQSSPDDFFEQKISGPLYLINPDTTRFLLCYYEEKYSTKEIHTDLWEKENNKYIWTIEHIFPEGEKIPKVWVDMIADGDSEKAKQYLADYTHVIGNLTITGYNSNLSNMAFDKKRDRKRGDSYIGYKNGLKLNEDLCNEDVWTVKKIKARTKKLITIMLKDYKLD